MQCGPDVWPLQRDLLAKNHRKMISRGRWPYIIWRQTCSETGVDQIGQTDALYSACE